MTEKKVYADFMEWLSQSWYGLPESEELLPLIKARFSEEEASFLTGFPYRRTPIAELAELKKMEEKELTEKLDALALKGLLWKDHKKGSLRYGLNDLFFSVYRSGFWPGREDEYTATMAPPANRYLTNGALDNFAMAENKGLRTLPIRETIMPNTTVKPYEDVVKLLDAFEYYTVSACPCRFRKQLDPDSETSKKPLEVCLHFDELGHYIVENNLGREITREETEQILKKAANAGLVHGLSNWQDKPDTICNCDKDHCFMFEAYHDLNHHKSLDRSNFEVETHPSTCKGCGLCVKRCPMEALKLTEYPDADQNLNKKGLTPLLTEDCCIGCGVCVVKCPTQSLILKEKREEDRTDPPQNALDWTLRYLEAAKSGKKLLR